MEQKKDKSNTPRPITVKCSVIAKQYSTAAWKRLAGINIGDAYTQLKKNGSILNQTAIKILPLIKEQLDTINDFVPHVPMTDTQRSSIKWYVDDRRAKLLHLMEKVQQGLKPIYLQDVVTQELAKRNSKIKCTDLHIGGYLYAFGITDVTPQKIADFILKFDDWNKLQPLLLKDTYHVRKNDNKKIDPSKFRRLVEYVYELEPDSKENINLDEVFKMLESDGKVVKEYISFAKKRTADYKEVYDKFIDFAKKMQFVPFPTPTDQTAAIVQPSANDSSIDDTPTNYTPSLPEQPTIEDACIERNNGHLSDVADNYFVLAAKVNGVQRYKNITYEDRNNYFGLQLSERKDFAHSLAIKYFIVND